jgi:hypothetical protein
MVGRWPSFQSAIRGQALAVSRPSADVNGERYPPPEGRMQQFREGLRGPIVSSAADRPLGNSVGAIGWPIWCRRGRRRNPLPSKGVVPSGRPPVRVGSHLVCVPLPLNYSALPLAGVGSARPSPPVRGFVPGAGLAGGGRTR